MLSERAVTQRNMLGYYAEIFPIICWETQSVPQIAANTPENYERSLPIIQGCLKGKDAPQAVLPLPKSEHFAPFVARWTSPHQTLHFSGRITIHDNFVIISSLSSEIVTR